MESDYEPFDLHRMFIGDFSALLMLEIGVRTVIMYGFALLVIRMLGKRGIGQLTPFEYVIIIALGSATGDPMFYTEVPLIHGMLVLTVVVALQRGVLELVKRNSTVELLLESAPSLLIERGNINESLLSSENMSKEELLTWLREAGVRNTGEVEYAFLESSGRVTVFTSPAGMIKPGQGTLAPEGLQR